MKQILATFGPEGEIRIEAAGFTGSDCLEATRFLEEALGRVDAQSLTTDYYQTSNEGRLQQRQ
ncbi:MAG: DUF2997 domain-containing protein (plasmid) [Candidatus Manganitrophus sp.]|nr:DUF2997 domain-containing protein [Candidatus Manganitrophus sp.]MDC4228116.1 DUF2997 domain-containing protein [Candidatus Manganitrophus sp.]WDT73637.1 MAG: DUF2997 domain-containing protein [Candidatus Manganitrophus sp.]